MSPAPAGLTTFLSRHSAMLAMAIVLTFTTAGTAAAVSYLVLGATNSAAATTTLKSGVDGAVLQVTNTNTSGGVNARGLGISVPAGQPPIKVNAAAGKATNLDADKVDGIDSSAFALGLNVRILANRVVINGVDSNPGVTLLELPALGKLSASCYTDGHWANIYWTNTTAYPIDTWTDLAGYVEASIAQPGDQRDAVFWAVDQNRQVGSTLILGHGNSPGARQTASVTLSAYRSVAGAGCAVQATATLWSTP